MRWPWVSRLAFDVVCAERDSWRAKAEVLTDAMLRLKRVEMGLREVPRPAPKADLQKPVEVPEQVRRLYEGRCQSPAIERVIEEQAVEMFKGGAPWAEVARLLTLQLGEPPEVVEA